MRPAVLRVALALAVGSASGCRPCEPGPWPASRVDWTFLERESGVISFSKGRGECKAGQVPPPKVDITSPSGEHYAARRVVVRGYDESATSDEVQIELDFREAGVYSLRLEYTETHVTTMNAVVAIDRQHLPSEVLEGIFCGDLWQNEKGTIGCTEDRAYTPIDAGPGSHFIPAGVILRNGQRLTVFSDGSRLYPGPSATFWVSTLDGGVLRYEDDGAGVPVESPAPGTTVEGTVLALVPQDLGAWVLTRDALHWVAFGDAGLAVQASHGLKPGAVALPALVTRGRWAFVATKPRWNVTELCGYQRADDGGLEDLPQTCSQIPDEVVAADGERLWLQWDELSVHVVAADEPRLVKLGALGAGLVDEIDPQSWWPTPAMPVSKGFVPRLGADGRLNLEYYTFDTRGWLRYPEASGANETLVWRANYGSDGGVRTAFGRRPP